jgi:hypothetical protein
LETTTVTEYLVMGLTNGDESTTATHPFERRRRSFFGESPIGCDSSNGQSLPDIGRVAEAYGLPEDIILDQTNFPELIEVVFGLLLVKESLASKASFRKHPNRVPWNLFVPHRM